MTVNVLNKLGNDLGCYSWISRVEMINSGLIRIYDEDGEMTEIILFNPEYADENDVTWFDVVAAD